MAPTPMQRKLTAILCADVVGYSTLMEADETGTLERLKANRRSIFDPHVATHGGRVFKLMGDGALVEFSSVIAAVNCALAIQQATARAGCDLSEAGRINYRMGINLGEVIVEGDDIYGDGVNVAARLQALAEPGGIALSLSVRDQVAGKIPAEIQDLGEHTVKNIARPVHVFAMRPSTAGVAPAAIPRERQRLSICVLPFANMSGDPEQGYFSDGITEDIITDLSKVSALAVVSRNTAFTFKAKHIDVAQVARELKVSHVLEGSVRKSGNRVRITAQLIDGATDSHLWAERFDRNLDDIFALQDEIAEAIVKALKLQLLPTEKQAIEQRATTNPEAYKLYLMARQYNATGNSRHRDITVRLCQRAVEIDPEYARAWALLAISQANRRLVNVDTGDTGWSAAERALALQPDLAEAHAAKGRILGDAGRYDEALAEHSTALRLDPDGYEVNAAAARCYIGLRRNQDAVGCLERAAAAIETDFWALGMAIQSYEAIGDIDGAKSAARRCLERVEKAIVAEPDHGLAIGFGVTALVALKEVDRAKEWTARAMLLDPDNTNLNFNLACSMVSLGEFDTAIELLAPIITRAQRQNLVWFESDTSLDPIRGDPRYQALVAQAEARLAPAQ
ncbi:MAG: tetratricopeptide repeat protein [Casimicrobiaceae bacterium]